MDMFLITLKQVCILVGYIFLGYLLCRKKIIGRDSSKIISKLLLYIISPCYIVSSLSREISAEKIIEYIIIIACGAVVAVLSIIISLIISRFFSKDKFEQNIYKYMFAFSNVGYFGYPLIGAIFGSQLLATFMLFVLPINVCIYSYGYFILTANPNDESAKMDKKEFRKILLKRIFSFPLISFIVAIILGLLPIEIPQIFYDVITPAGNCYSALAMWLVGIALSSYSLKELFCSFKPYLTSVFRLIFIPLVVGGLALLMQRIIGFDRNIVTFVVAFTCLPAGMNVVVYPESVGLDGSFGAKSCFISYIMALATIPVWFYLLNILV